MAPPKVQAKHTARLAERQAHRWELQRQSGAEQGGAPCVAISRLPGSGGAEVGRRVAEWLDYGFFGREIVEGVAREMGVDHWLVSGLDERVRRKIERFVDETFAHRTVSEDDVLRHVAKTIATLGRRGSAVIVGRGAPFLLPPERALRVLLIAPREQRVARYAELKSLGPAEAAQALEREEQRRKDFGMARFGVDYTDPSHYDVSINTGRMSHEAAAGVVIAALRRRFPA